MKKQDNRWQTSKSFWEKLKPKAREMRAKPTEAERILWQYLRNNKLHKHKFRHQHGLGQFIVDFYCKETKLVIELDGPIHKHQIEKDIARQQYLEQHKYQVLRFTNDAVMNHIGNVIKTITEYCDNH